jgi:hypothetical protein
MVTQFNQECELERGRYDSDYLEWLEYPVAVALWKGGGPHKCETSCGEFQWAGRVDAVKAEAVLPHSKSGGRHSEEWRPRVDYLDL